MKTKLFERLKMLSLLPWLGMISDKLYKFSPSEEGVKLSEISSFRKLKCILLTRENYHEVQKEYPVESFHELNKILDLEVTSDSSKVSLYRIGDYINNRRVVTFAHINDDVIQSYPGFNKLICIPESWIIGSIYNSKLIYVNSYVQPYWLYQNSSKIHSHQAKGLFSSSDAFCAAAGIKVSEPALNIEGKDVIKIFSEQCVSFIVKNYKGLWISNSNKQALNFSHFIPGAVTCIGVLICYVFGVSFYLDYQLKNEKELQRKLTNESGELFSLQAQIKSQAIQITELEGSLLKPSVQLEVWKGLQPLFLKEDIIFKRVTAFANNSVSFMGESPKATAVLELLSQQPTVNDAKFQNDVVEINNLERFIISYTIEGKSMDVASDG